MKLSHYLVVFVLAFSSCKKDSHTTAPPVEPPVADSLTFKWAKTFGNADAEGLPKIATDDAGNVYLTGTFKGIVDFDPGAGVQNLTAGTTGATYFAKYDKNGDFVFAKNISVAGLSYQGMGADAAGNVYFAGNFSGRVDVDPGPGDQTLVSKGGTDIFVVKYDTGGNVIGKFYIGNSQNDDVKAITVDKAGNFFLGGNSRGVIDMDPGTAVKNLHTPLCFLSKYNTSGALVFFKDISTFEENELVIDPRYVVLTTDDEGSVHAAGSLFADEYYNAIPNHGADKGKYTVGLVKLDAAGKYVYAKPDNFGPLYYLTGISTDANKNVCIAGEYDELVVFISKFDNNGNHVFTTVINDSGIRSAAFDHFGNIYASYSEHGDDFVTKFKPDGKLSSKAGIAGGATFFSRSKAGLYMGGLFYEPTVDLDFGGGTDTHTSHGFYDVFFSRYELP